MPPEPQAGADPPLATAVERHLERWLDAFDGTDMPTGIYHRILAEVEKPLIRRILQATRGNQIRAAEMLGLNRNTLRKKIRDHDIQLIRGP